MKSCIHLIIKLLIPRNITNGIFRNPKITVI